MMPVCDPTPRAYLGYDVGQLPEDRCLARAGELAVYIARADEVPSVMREIGRLREITFRATGEGTGHETDIDRYDRYYHHLFVWHTRKLEVVGAYRLGPADEIRARFGKKGLYTHSLFKYRGKLLETINPAIELGRSFVREEYQRSYAPLMLLWKGIGAFVAHHPQYTVLFGPVSISNDYHLLSQQLIVAFLRHHAHDAQLSRYVRPRQPFNAEAGASSLAGLSAVDMEALGKLVSLLEPDDKGLPILLRQYLKLGGRMLGFNVDAAFNSLDGLVMVDLRETDPRVLSKYMGSEAAADYLAFHGAADLCA